MHVDVVGEPWRLDEPPSGLLRRVESLHVAPLLRSDFDAAALERLGSGRRLLLDAQGLVRVPKTGPLTLDADFDPDVLRHVSILKVSEEEADVLAGGDRDALADLGVPEIVLTLGDARLGRDRERPRRADSRTAGRGRRRSDRRRRRVLERLPLRARERACARVGGAARDCARRSAPARARTMIAARPHGRRRRAHRPRGRARARRPTSFPPSTRPSVELPRVVATARSGSTIVAVVDRRPPLAISRDNGSTWREAGGGLPTGFAVAIAEDDPDRMLYAARNRLYVSDERRRLLARADARAAGRARCRLDRLNERAHVARQSWNSPRATTTAEPPTSIRSIASALPSTRA